MLLLTSPRLSPSFSSLFLFTRMLTCGTAGRYRGKDGADLRAAFCGRDEVTGFLRKVKRAFAGLVLQFECEAGGITKTGDWRRVDGEDRSLRNLHSGQPFTLAMTASKPADRFFQSMSCTNNVAELGAATRINRLYPLME